VLWLDVPLEEVRSWKISQYIDFLHRRRLSAKTINCHLHRLRQFYDYLFQEEGVAGANPVKKDHALRMSRPLPKSLKDEDLRALFRLIKNRRDRAMFMLMLRCGLRVEEVAKLSFDVIEFRRRTVVVLDPKWGKDRVVYLSDDALKALLDYPRGKADVHGDEGLSRRKRHLPRQPSLDPRDPEAHGILRQASRPLGLLSSPAPYDGHSHAQCRGGVDNGPGPPRPHLDHDHSTVLPPLEPEGQK